VQDYPGGPQGVQHRLIEYAEMFRGTIDSASVYQRELVKEAPRRNAAAVGPTAKRSIRRR
jgi:hypothetical protein